MKKNKLKEYNNKRNFEKTLEPVGEYAAGASGTEKKTTFLKFCVQHHIATRDHFDFRLEWEGSLLSWAVPKGPSYNPLDKRLAIQVENHPLTYRDFEGTIPKGEYGGGTVMLWDEGFWEALTDPEEGLRKGSLKFILKGKRLKGKWALVRLKEKEKKDSDNWLLIKEKDEHAKTSNGISKYKVSIKSARTMSEIAKGEAVQVVKNPISSADVQLAKLADKVPEGDEWLFEMKYDGYRILAFIEEGRVRLVTRNENDVTSKFKHIADCLSLWAGRKAMILDGEMTVIDSQGKTDFQALQNYFKKPTGKNLTYIVFDILSLGGTDLREQTLLKRKQLLESLMADAPCGLYYSNHVEGNGKQCFKAACQLGMEGIIGKRAHSIYSGTRNGDWVKLKCDTRQEFVIGGYTLSDKKISGISSILLGVYQGKDLIYAGRAGTGFSQKIAKELEEKFLNIKAKKSPFKQTPKDKTNEKITWLKPIMVAEIKFAEWTKENLLRQASFKGLRIDKDAKKVNMERAGTEMPNEKSKNKQVDKGLGNQIKQSDNGLSIGGINISSPEKIMFKDSKITKSDVAQYYANISQYMIPYLERRILSIVRCPKGISSSCFFKKHPNSDNKGVVVLPIVSSKGEKEDYFYIENVYGLISEVQMCTLEFHTWGSRIDDLEKPDIMVFDLDPDEDLNLDKVRQGVKDLKSLLDELSLVSFLKTSGGKGYHVVVPFKPLVKWAAFYDFAKRIAEVMEIKWPDRYTSNMRKDRRKGKIFIDWIRNGRGATSIAPYSIRARKGAKVSMPISWAELETIAPDSINMAEALLRVKKGDPWKDFFVSGQTLKI